METIKTKAGFNALWEKHISNSSGNYVQMICGSHGELLKPISLGDSKVNDGEIALFIVNVGYVVITAKFTNKKVSNVSVKRILDITNSDADIITESEFNGIRWDTDPDAELSSIIKEAYRRCQKRNSTDYYGLDMTPTNRY